jgi:hypothetical protein
MDFPFYSQEASYVLCIRTMYQGTFLSSWSMASKCLSRVKSVPPTFIQDAAIHTSLMGIYVILYENVSLIHEFMKEHSSGNFWDIRVY